VQLLLSTVYGVAFQLAFGPCTLRVSVHHRIEAVRAVVPRFRARARHVGTDVQVQVTPSSAIKTSDAVQQEGCEFCALERDTGEWSA
jgi:hypothetical protein